MMILFKYNRHTGGRTYYSNCTIYYVCCRSDILLFLLAKKGKNSKLTTTCYIEYKYARVFVII